MPNWCANDLTISGKTYDIHNMLFLFDKDKEGNAIFSFEKIYPTPDELLNKDDNYKEKIMQYFHKMKWKDPKYIENKEGCLFTYSTKISFVLSIEASSTTIISSTLYVCASIEFN